MNFVSLLDPDIEALNKYDNLYYGMESEDESIGNQQDFHRPLQSSDRTLQVKPEDKSNLGGSKEQAVTSVLNHPESFHTTAQKSTLRLGRDFTSTRKFPLN